MIVAHVRDIVCEINIFDLRSVFEILLCLKVMSGLRLVIWNVFLKKTKNNIIIFYFIFFLHSV
jgi:hypothetical protein